MSESSREMFKLLSMYSHIGMTVVFSIFIGMGIGWYLDNKVFGGPVFDVKTSPYLTFIFLGFGIAAGFRSLWRLKKSLDNE